MATNITSPDIGHQSPAQSLPPLRFKSRNHFSWGTGGNTAVVNDVYCNAKSMVLWQVEGGIPAAGNWSIVPGNQTFTITSSDSESSSLLVYYILL